MVNVKTALALVVLLVSMALGIHSMDKGGGKMAGDRSISRIVERLDCAILCSHISETKYAPYDIIENSGIERIHSWPAENKIVELYKGQDNGYLAILRKDDKVYCAQYLNDLCPEDLFDHTDIPENVYYYELENSASGIYIRTRIVFFTDGRVYRQLFSYPSETVPFKSMLNTNENILSFAAIKIEDTQNCPSDR